LLTAKFEPILNQSISGWTPLFEGICKKPLVEGHLRNRNESCHNPIQLYLRNELFDWIEQNATAGRGGTQIVINYLVRRGIEAVEKEFQENGIVFADEGK
jgi:hypothetical protein